MTRTLTIHGSAPPPPPPAGNAAASGGGEGVAAPGSETPSLGLHLSSLVRLPTAAEGWKVTQTSDEKTGVSVTAARTLAAGATIHNDLGIKASAAPAGKEQPAAGDGLLIENTASVRSVGPNQMEYREVLHWRGPRPKELNAPDPEIQAVLKRALPPALASDTITLGKVQTALARDLWHVLFGPGDPILPILMLHPDLAEYRLHQQLQGAVRRALVDAYGDRLTPTQTDTAVAHIVADVAASMETRTQSHSPAAGLSGSDSPENSSDNTPPVALLLRVKMPGKVTATNGQIDPESGEVYWALYSEAPAIADVTLTATCVTGQARE